MDYELTEETLEEGRVALYQLERQLKERSSKNVNDGGSVTSSKANSSAQERRLLDQMSRGERLNNRQESLGLTIEELDDRGLLDGGASLPSYYTSMKQKSRRLMELQSRTHRLQGTRGKETLSKILSAFLHMIRILVRRGLDLEEYCMQRDPEKRGLLNRKLLFSVLRGLGLPFATRELQEIIHHYSITSSDKADYMAMLRDARVLKKSAAAQAQAQTQGGSGAAATDSSASATMAAASNPTQHSSSRIIDDPAIEAATRGNIDIGAYTVVLSELKRMLLDAIRSLNKHPDDVYRMFARWDTQGTSTVTATQFLRVLVRLHINLSDQDQDFLVELLDTNAMGRIDFEGLLSFCFEGVPGFGNGGGGSSGGGALSDQDAGNMLSPGAMSVSAGGSLTAGEDNGGESLSAVSTESHKSRGSLHGGNGATVGQLGGAQNRRPQTATISRPYNEQRATNAQALHNSTSEKSNTSRPFTGTANSNDRHNSNGDGNGNGRSSGGVGLDGGGFGRGGGRADASTARPGSASDGTYRQYPSYPHNHHHQQQQQQQQLYQEDVLELPDDVINGEEKYLGLNTSAGRTTITTTPGYYSTHSHAAQLTGAGVGGDNHGHGGGRGGGGGGGDRHTTAGHRNQPPLSLPGSGSGSGDGNDSSGRRILGASHERGQAPTIAGDTASLLTDNQDETNFGSPQDIPQIRQNLRNSGGWAVAQNQSQQQLQQPQQQQQQFDAIPSSPNSWKEAGRQQQQAYQQQINDQHHHQQQGKQQSQQQQQQQQQNAQAYRSSQQTDVHHSRNIPSSAVEVGSNLGAGPGTGSHADAGVASREGGEEATTESDGPIDHLVLLANQTLSTLRDIIMTRYRRGRSLHEIFQHFARDSKGHFDAGDFVTATADLRIETSPRVASIAVRLIALDGYDKVSFGEFKVFVLDSDHQLLELNVQEQLAQLLEQKGREYQAWMVDTFWNEEDTVNESRASTSAKSDRQNGFVTRNAFINALHKIGAVLTSSEVNRLVDRFDVQGNDMCSVIRFVRMVHNSRAWKHAERVLAYQDEAIEEAEYLRTQLRRPDATELVKRGSVPDLSEELISMCEYLGIRVMSEQNMVWIAADALKAPLPVSWTARKDKTGRTYFYNHMTNQSKLEHPLDPHFRKLRDKYRQSLAESEVEGSPARGGGVSSQTAQPNSAVKAVAEARLASAHHTHTYTSAPSLAPSHTSSHAPSTAHDGSASCAGYHHQHHQHQQQQFDHSAQSRPPKEQGYDASGTGTGAGARRGMSDGAGDHDDVGDDRELGPDGFGSSSARLLYPGLSPYSGPTRPHVDDYAGSLQGFSQQQRSQHSQHGQHRQQGHHGQLGQHHRGGGGLMAGGAGSSGGARRRPQSAVNSSLPASRAPAATAGTATTSLLMASGGSRGGGGGGGGSGGGGHGGRGSRGTPHQQLALVGPHSRPISAPLRQNSSAPSIRGASGSGGGSMLLGATRPGSGTSSSGRQFGASGPAEHNLRNVGVYHDTAQKLRAANEKVGNTQARIEAIYRSPYSKPVTLPHSMQSDRARTYSRGSGAGVGAADHRDSRDISRGGDLYSRDTYRDHQLGGGGGGGGGGGSRPSSAVLSAAVAAVGLDQSKKLTEMFEGDIVEKLDNVFVNRAPT